MPSPFPGIDPYLEAQGFSDGFYWGFTTYCRDSLNDLLPGKYVAQLNERLHFMEFSVREAKQIHPDVVVGDGRRASRSATSRTQAEATVTLEPLTIPLPGVKMQVRHSWIEIHRMPRRAPIAVIEVLSPSNKVGDGFSEYRLKRRKTIEHKIHLIEFDFLLRGHRLPMDRALPRGDFFALVARANRRPDCDVYAWSIRGALPRIPIPLLAPDPDVILDLGPIFTTAYEKGRYSHLVDYSAPLTLVRKPDNRVWAERVARWARR